jgi:hypothetical protein
MKLIINTATNTIQGTIEGRDELLPNIIYMNIPAGFDMACICDYTLVNGELTLDPTAALSRAKRNAII